MGGELLDGRRAALDLVAQTVERDRLSAEEADSWLRALNDLRLVLGTRLDVQEDTFAGSYGPTTRARRRSPSTATSRGCRSS